MTCLVAGGAGFIGSHLVDALLEAGHFVVCADNLSHGSERNIEHCRENPGFAFYKLDLCKDAGLDELFEKYDIKRVYHLAANSDIQRSGNDPDIDFHDTFMTTVSLLNAMRQHDVRELLFSSSSAIYGDKRVLLKEDTGDLRPASYYGAAKLASEAFISAYAAMNDMSAVIIRFPNVAGPRLTHGVVFDFIKKLKKDPAELLILGDGNQEKPYLYVTDLTDAMLQMKYSGNVEVFNVGVDTSTKVTRIADIVCEEMGLSNVTYRYTGGETGWPGDVPGFQYDLSKIRAFGWKAKYTSDDAVRLAARSSI